ncbi:TPA: c-type cytochrome [Enterobacter hormaechei subsp. steigerwaltii]|nr:c-type cytochrome [Enterobacter hormaechei subsp. steigerwaltii]
MLLLSVQSAFAQDEAAIERGRYMAVLGDCASCHTADDSKPFAGGVKFSTPVGNIYSANITPDKNSGIGAYTYEEFADAIRKGVARDGSALYPAMPYPSFSKIRDSDVQDLYAYFMNAVQPVKLKNRDTDIPWPLSMRWPLQFWRFAFSGNAQITHPEKADPQWLRGAYLVQGLGHCGACHTPRGVALQEKAYDQTGDAWLSGGMLDTWYAPPLSGNPTRGLGAWTQQDIVDFLKTGTNSHSTAFGPMTEVIGKSTQFFRDDDLNAIAVYLNSLKAGNPQSSERKEVLSKNIRSPELSGTIGEKLYIDNCSACHSRDGKGVPDVFPALANNTALLSDNPSSIVSVVMSGSIPVDSSGNFSGVAMPAFSSSLNDEQIAEVLNYIRQQWGNTAGKVTQEEVQHIRSKISEPMTP